ncbi:MAG: ABC transporter ATP-binding protein [Peptoniphilaceae bacterium]|uniref:ABC transporter ATP-binding protein n=1 Tax=Parvimonas sp. TaxID=1944660 RepID=UPI0025D228A4|nr:ABC transporter ATP-binding protein [Parvimonas sp.]MCI5997430.1 ABC transporter ATP-binding protein [Parvimonas sp.]MDD7764455.1 ABC transporter ATP-binding protein [Peptoniphilaceae bacterium]MDY3051144.1 ABC transporter ATP-binding protein [Parvimonas sp.]
MSNLLEIKNLSVQYDTDSGLVSAVNNLSLSVGRKETLGFVGETGAGKTTTALSIMKLIQSPPGKITQGEVIFEGQDLLKVKEKDMFNIRGNKISMIFQDPMTSLNPIMTVGNQIKEVLELHQKLSKSELVEKTAQMLEMVGIRRERMNDYPHQFSGGMKQRVVIAMALACNPELIIADEPTTALDVTIQAQVLELMKNLKESYNTSMILITHDLGIVAEICDKVSVVYAGTIVEHSDVESLYKNPLHPYTVGLFDSIPSLDEDSERLRVIEGNPPDPSNLPTGCCFHPRCKKCMEICKKVFPKEVEVEKGHFVACHLYSKPEGVNENER